MEVAERCLKFNTLQLYAFISKAGNFFNTREVGKVVYLSKIIKRLEVSWKQLKFNTLQLCASISKLGNFYNRKLGKISSFENKY